MQVMNYKILTDIELFAIAKALEVDILELLDDTMFDN